MAEINEALELPVKLKLELKDLAAQLKLIENARTLALSTGNTKGLEATSKELDAVKKLIANKRKELDSASLAKLRAEHPEIITFLDLSAAARKKVAAAVQKTGALPYEVQIRKGLKFGMTTMVGAQSAYRTTRNIAAINSGNAAAAEAGYAALEQEQARAVSMQIASKERRRLNFSELKALKKEFETLPDGWQKTTIGKHIVQISKTMVSDRRYTKKNREAIAEIGSDVSKQLDLMKAGSLKTPAYLSAIGHTLNSITDGMWAGNGRAPITGIARNIMNNAGKYGSAIGGVIGLLAGGPAGGVVGSTLGGGIGELGGAAAKFVHEPWTKTAERALTIRDRKALLGSAYNHNFTENMAEMYGINEGSLVNMTENARYFKARAAFGQVSENEMLGSALLPNFHNAMINGGGTADLVSALRRDMAEQGQDKVYMGLRMKGLSTDLMSLSGVNFERALQGTQEQEAKDVANILEIIREWADRSKLDLWGMRTAANSVYGGLGRSESQRRIAWLFNTDPSRIHTDFGMKKEQPIIIENTTNVNLDGSTIKTDKSERQVMNTWVGMSTPAR